MTDLHTHILPGMDDGAKDLETSLAMLRAEQEQEIETVALTPHFYRDLESPDAFLRRRADACDTLRRAIDTLSEAERRALPTLVLGAEVAWVPGVADWPELRALCYAGTDYLLLEPPFRPWDENFFGSLYNLMTCGGVTPVIAHLDRYLGGQTLRALERLSELGLPTQISAEPFLHWRTRGRMLRLLSTGRARLLISDCHDLEVRPPNLGVAMEVIRKKRGSAAQVFSDAADALLKPDSSVGSDALLP